MLGDTRSNSTHLPVCLFFDSSWTCRAVNGFWHHNWLLISLALFLNCPNSNYVPSTFELVKFLDLVILQHFKVVFGRIFDDPICRDIFYDKVHQWEKNTVLPKSTVHTWLLVMSQLEKLCWNWAIACQIHKVQLIKTKIALYLNVCTFWWKESKNQFLLLKEALTYLYDRC